MAELHGYHNLIYATIGTIEETLEMVGVIIFIYALLEYINSYLSSIQVQSLNQYSCKSLLFLLWLIKSSNC